MNDNTLSNKEVKKMENHKKPSGPVEEERWAESSAGKAYLSELFSEGR